MSDWVSGYRAALRDVESLAIKRDAATPAILLLVSDLICDALVIEREADNRIRRRRLAAVREATLFDEPPP